MKSPVLRFTWGAVNTAVMGLMLLPVVFVGWSAFYDSTFLTFPPPGYTLRWFGAALQREAFVSGLATSAKVALMAATAGVVIGTAASLVLQRSKLRGTQFLQTLLVSPLMVPNIVLGIALYLFFISMADRTGVDLSQGLAGLTLAHTLLTLPWSVRLITANLTGLDQSLEEAAMNLGASPMRTFFLVTLPQLRAGMIAAALFSFIISFENLEISLFLVGPGASTFPIALMQYLEFNMDPTVAAASTLQVVLIAALLVITDRYVKLSRVV